MSLAFIHATEPGTVDETLRSVAAALAAQGLRLAGVVPHAAVPAGSHPCDMNLVDLHSGRLAAIHQPLGKESHACRLDADALEAIVAVVERGVEAQRPDLLIVNRFGKIEAIGRGFCPLIARALEAGIPVLVGVNDLNRQAFDAFASGMALELPDRESAIMDWVAPLRRRTAA